MNNIEKIIGRIADDAQAQIDKINAEYAENSAKLREEYEFKTKQACSEIMEKAEQNAAVIAERRESASQMDAGKLVLSAKQKILSDVFHKASEKLCNLPEDEYVSLLAKLAADHAESGEEKIVLSAKDKEQLGQAVCDHANKLLEQKGKKGALKLSEETRAIEGGLILVSGKIEFNCEIEKLVASYKSELSMEVAKILFD